MRTDKGRWVAVVLSVLAAMPVQASFHFMQIEQVPADYAVTAGAAVYSNNAGASNTVPVELQSFEIE